MRRIAFAALLAVALSGCTAAGLLAGARPGAFCNSMMASLPQDHAALITRELRKEPAPGWLTEPYSPAHWNELWNDVVFNTTDVGPDSCKGTYRGPSGRDMVRTIIARRREIGLPEIQLEARNQDKADLLQ